MRKIFASFEPKLLALLLLLLIAAGAVVAQEKAEPTLAPPEPAQSAIKSADKPADKPAASKEPVAKQTPRLKAEEIDIDELLRQLETVIRDPFSPDRAITREQKKANNEFVEVASPQALPEISLVCYGESGEGEAAEHLVGLKIDGRIYFVRKEDRVTLPRSSGNLVIEITSISRGFVEVKVGTLAESIIIR